MAVIAVTAVTNNPAGTTLPAPAACSVGGDTVEVGSDDVIVNFYNTNAAARVVTIDSLKPCEQGSDHNGAITVPALTGRKSIRLNPRTRWRNASGVANVTYDAVTNLTVEAIRLA